jgi:hypothetical protein
MIAFVYFRLLIGCLLVHCGFFSHYLFDDNHVLALVVYQDKAEMICVRGLCMFLSFHLLLEHPSFPISFG